MLIVNGLRIEEKSGKKNHGAGNWRRPKREWYRKPKGERVF